MMLSSSNRQAGEMISSGEGLVGMDLSQSAPTMDVRVLLACTDQVLMHQLVSSFEDRRIDTVVTGTLPGFRDALPGEYDAVVIDAALASHDAFELCRQAAMLTRAPLLVLTRQDDPIERMFALEIGADYVACRTGPPAELVAQIRAAARRQDRLRPGVRTWSLGQWRFDPAKRSLTGPNGVTHWLTSNNSRLLDALVCAAGECLSRNDIAARMSERGEEDAHNADWGVRIYRLRKAIERIDPKAEIIVTHHRRGYLVRTSPDGVLRSQAR